MIRLVLNQNNYVCFFYYNLFSKILVLDILQLCPFFIFCVNNFCQELFVTRLCVSYFCQVFLLTHFLVRYYVKCVPCNVFFALWAWSGAGLAWVRDAECNGTHYVRVRWKGTGEHVRAKAIADATSHSSCQKQQHILTTSHALQQQKQMPQQQPKHSNSKSRCHALQQQKHAIHTKSKSNSNSTCHKP